MDLVVSFADLSQLLSVPLVLTPALLFGSVSRDRPGDRHGHDAP